MEITKKNIETFITFQKFRSKAIINWFIYNEMWLVIIVSIFLCLLSLSFLRDSYLRNNDNYIVVMLLFLLTIILPITVNKSLLLYDKKVNILLLSVLDEKELIQLKQIQSILINLIIFIALVHLIIPNFLYNYSLLFITGLCFLIIHSIIYPIYIKHEDKRKISKNGGTILWSVKIKNNNLPIRAIIARDWLYFKRFNRSFLLKYIFYVTVINFLSIIFIINNQLFEFIYVSFLLQYLVSIIFILDLPNKNNRNLLTINKKNLFTIVKAEFIIWSLTFTIQFIIVFLLYLYYIPAISTIILLGEFVLIAFLLLYGLLIKNVYELGIVYFIISILFFPIIPFIIYRSIKEYR